MSKPDPIQPPQSASTDEVWTRLRVRVEEAARAGYETANSPEKIDAIFKTRARQLAAPSSGADETFDANSIEVVMVSLGGQTYALESASVREAVVVPRITPLPGVALTVRGLVNVRSRIVPVFDVRPLLNLPVSNDPGDDATVLLLAFDGSEFGLLIDATLGVGRISPARLRRELPGTMTEYLQGVTDDGHILVDLAALVDALTANDDY